MTILDEVLDDLDATIAAHPPERGGLLFGPRNRDLITLFVFDDGARTTAVTYTPSADICRRAPEIEARTRLEYKGLVHSHPGSFDRTSGGDKFSAAKALQSNLHLGSFFMPIITGRQARCKLPEHELHLDHGKLSGFVALRDRSGSDPGVIILEEPLRELPLRRHLRS